MSPVCSCGTTMVEEFDYRAINELATAAIPTGNFRCMKCGAVATADDAADPDTAELLAALDALYPLPDDDTRTERAGRTCFALKRWMSAKHEELEAAIPRAMARFFKFKQPDNAPATTTGQLGYNAAYVPVPPQQEPVKPTDPSPSLCLCGPDPLQRECMKLAGATPDNPNGTLASGYICRRDAQWFALSRKSAEYGNYFTEGRCSGHQQFNGRYCRDAVGPERWCINCAGVMLVRERATLLAEKAAAEREIARLSAAADRYQGDASRLHRQIGEAERARDEALSTDWAKVAQQLQRDCSSEIERRTAAQEAITLHWQPKAHELETQLTEAESTVFRLTAQLQEAQQELDVATEAMDVQAHFHSVWKQRAEAAESQLTALHRAGMPTDPVFAVAWIKGLMAKCERADQLQKQLTALRDMTRLMRPASEKEPG